MAVPAYATDLTSGVIYEDSDNFSTVGGGRVTDTETDDYIQGNNCWSHDPFSSGIEGGVYDTVSAPTITAGDAVFIWTKCDVAATLATHAAGGVQAIIGNSATAYYAYYVRGSDDYAYGGWQCIPIDPTLYLSASTTVSSPTGTFDHFGIRWNVPGAGASKGYPMKIDAMRHGKILEVIDGEIGTPATWDTVSAYDATGTRQWGICQPTDSGAALQGFIYWGTASAEVYSRDSNRTIAIIDTEWTDTDFTQILFAHASNDVVWDNVGLIALGTSNRGIIDVTADGSVTWTNSVFQGIDITNMLADSTFDGSTWIGTNQVTTGGGSLFGASVLESTVALDTGAVYQDVAYTDTYLDGMTISKGSAAHHAIAFGTAVTSNLTLRDCNFNGFGSTDDSDDSAVQFLATSGALTLSLIGCTVDGAEASLSNFSVDDAVGSLVVTVSIDPVDITITVQDEGKDPIENAQTAVFLLDSPFTELMNKDTSVAGIATESYGGSLPVDISWRVRKSETTDNPRYFARSGTGEVTSNGFTLTVTLEESPL